MVLLEVEEADDEVEVAEESLPSAEVGLQTDLLAELVVDLVAELDRNASVEQINEAFKKAAEGPMKGILSISNEPLVSIDFLDDPHSAIVDAQNTKVLGGNLVKVLA